MPETILVVDDDPDIARFVEVNLRSAGYDVAVAGDGEEALERAGELRPDLVLLDVMMPRIDGFEVAQRLRKNPQTANTSIIMLTAKALSADKVTGLQSGADDYIIKPFDPIELLARVKGTLRRAKEMRNLSPLTGLPGNIRIQEEIERQVREARPVRRPLLRPRQLQGLQRPEGVRARRPADPDHGAHHPGRRRGQGRVPRASSATSAATTSWRWSSPETAEGVAQRICERFDEALVEFYEPEDLERGFVRIEDRKGVLQDIPLVAISVGIAEQLQPRVRPLRRGGGGGDRDEAVRQARRRRSFAIDQRTA